MAALANPRHERFAQELAKGKTADEAYQIAGYKASRPHASRLATKGNVSARVVEIAERAAVRVEFSIADAARQLDEDRDLAHAVKQPGAAVSASLGKAKLFGLLTEKISADLTHRDAKPDELDDSLLAHIASRGRDGAVEAAPGETGSDSVH